MSAHAAGETRFTMTSIGNTIATACRQAYASGRFAIDAARFGVGGVPALVIALVYVVALVALVFVVGRAWQ